MYELLHDIYIYMFVCVVGIFVCLNQNTYLHQVLKLISIASTCFSRKLTSMVYVLYRRTCIHVQMNYIELFANITIGCACMYFRP